MVNYFQADISGWKNGVDAIYSHLTEGGNRHATMQFAFEYNNEERNLHISRATDMYYHFVLYADGKPVGAVMEGHIDNFDPWNIA